MTTTSIQEYLADIEQLLDEEQFESVVGHSYHILKQFPRHVDTYRILAKGLLGLNRQEEAAELFHRILSADPHDLISHIALADIAQTNGDSDVAQYHLERAFELDPYNGPLQDELKRYYDTGDDFGIGRIQLNSGSLAHLYMRGEMYDHATAVLEELVGDEQGRIDLEVLLAEALWRGGNRVEAAEASLRVLDNLPNCIVANAILTEIWFGSDRIGDAKKHARNLQSMVLVDRKSIDPETVVGTALTVEGAPKLPDLIQINMLDSISSEDVAVSIQEIKPDEDATIEDVESDPGDMYDWLSGVVNPSAEQRMEEVIEPDSWPAGETDIESDWFSDEAVTDDTAVSNPLGDSFFDDLVLDDSHRNEQAQESAEAEIIDENVIEESQKDTADEFVLKFNEQAKEDAAVPEWIATDNADTSSLSSGQDSTDLFPTDEAGIPDWLNQAANQDFEPVQLDPMTASQWLREGTSDEEDDDYEKLPDSVKDSQDWMADLNKEFSEIVDEDANDPAFDNSWLIDDSLADEESEPSEVKDWFTAISDSPLNDDTQQAAEDLGEELRQESDDWLTNIADQALINESFDNESNPTLETKIVDDPAPDFDAKGSDEDWASEDWLFDDDPAVADHSATAEVQDVAENMNDDEPINENEDSKKDSEPKNEPVNDALSEDWLSQLTKDNADDDDWLAELSGGDEALDLFGEDENADSAEAKDSVDEFLAELSGDEEVKPLEDGEDLEDINQWLDDLSSEQGQSPDDWLAHLVEDEEDEESGKIFTDWLNQTVVEGDAPQSDHELFEGKDELGLKSDSLDNNNLTGLTDLLGEAEIEDAPSEKLSDDLIAESEINWLDEQEGLTDLLEEADEASIDFEEDLFSGKSDAIPSLTDMLDGAEVLESDEPDAIPSLTDILGEPDALEEKIEDNVLPSLTDTLESEELPSELVSESDADWLDGEGGLTDMLSEAGLSFADSESQSDGLDDGPSLTDLLDSDRLPDESGEQALPSLTDMLESENLPSEILEESEGDWLDGEGGLTDMLSEAGMTLDSGDESETAVGDDLLDLAEPPSLTDLLEESQDEPQEDLLESDWISREAGLTDLLAESDAPIEQAEEIQADNEPGLTDMLAEESGLTDLLADSDPFEALLEEEAPQEEAGLTDMLAEESGLTDLLSDSDHSAAFENDTGLTDLLENAGYIEEANNEVVPTLTDMLNAPEELTDLEEDSIFEPPNLEEILENGLIDNSDDDALDQIDTNLPEWLSTGGSSKETQSSIPDWMTEDNDDLDIDLDDDFEDEADNNKPSATGLLRKLDDIPSIKASIEAEEQAAKEAKEQADFEPEMADFLTKPADTAWLNQLGESDDLPDGAVSGLDWMTDVSSDPDLEWLDTGEGDEEESITPEEAIVEDEDFIEEDRQDTPGDLDDAMSWLEDLAAEQQKPIEPLPTVAEVLDEDDPEILNTLLEEDGASDLDELLAEPEDETDENIVDDSPILEDAPEDEEELVSDIDDALAEIDDAMAWLDDLNNQADELADENNALITDAEDETAVSQPLLDTPTPELDELNLAQDEGELTEFEGSDVPDDIDDAMAWLEQLAAKQGAPLDELPSISEDDTAVIESESTVQYSPPTIEENKASLPAELASALNWIEETSDMTELDTSRATEAKTTTADLEDALNWLEDVANQPIDAPSEAKVDVQEGPLLADDDGDLELDEFFDFPDNPEDAMAWLDELSEEEIAENRAARGDEPEEDLSMFGGMFGGSSAKEPKEAEELEAGLELAEETAVEEEQPEIKEPVAEVDEADSEESEDDIEALFESGAFDFPDDPDDAMAWLGELSEKEIAENRAARGDEPEEDLSMFGGMFGGSPTKEPKEAEESEVAPVVAEVEPPVLEESERIEETKVVEENSLIDEDASDLLTHVPEDPDEAMKWLEQLAARQGAPIEELPSVTEVDEVDEVPDWIKGSEDEPKFASGDSDGTSPLPTLGLEDIDSVGDTDDLQDELPDWFTQVESSDDEEVQSEADWLDSVPEFGGTGWLSSEGEAASTASESTDLLPDTGPLIEQASGSTGPLPDLNPLDSQSELYDEPSVNDEPDSAVYKMNASQLDVAKDDIQSEHYDGAIATLQSMVALGNGLMMLIGELESISDENPNHPAFRRVLGDAYMRNGQLQKALVTYRQALDQL